MGQDPKPTLLEVAPRHDPVEDNDDLTGHSPVPKPLETFYFTHHTNQHLTKTPLTNENATAILLEASRTYLAQQI